MGEHGSRVLPLGGEERHPRLITPRLIVRRSSHLAPVEEPQNERKEPST